MDPNGTNENKTPVSASSQTTEPGVDEETRPGLSFKRRRFMLTSTAGVVAFMGRGASAQVTTGNPAQVSPKNCTTVTLEPTAERVPPQEASSGFSGAETILAFRNHGMQAELLSEPITPLGCHYLLIHFDIPKLDATKYSLVIGGRVRKPVRLSLDEIKSKPKMSQVVTMECAGVGRSTLHPRSIYVPWFKEAIGTYQWTGTRLRPLLEQAGLLDDAVDVLFTGWDTGIDLGVEHAFERSLSVADALNDDVMLAWEANGQTLLPQHGFPLRLIVPSWYGMASVKWLRAITVLNETFQGVEQFQVYRYQQVKGELGEPLTHKRVHSALKPPGIPDLVTRRRFVAPGNHVLEGMAWSGAGRIVRVEVSTDDARTWGDATLVPVSIDRYAWTQWRFPWQAKVPGEYMIACRATDEKGNKQPIDPNAAWNRQGMGVNGVQRVHVTVQPGIGAAQLNVPSRPRIAVAGAKAPPVPTVVNKMVDQ
ncbi:sulfite oxidase [Massilia sp. CMS3.1]|uniref:sulfite oxidase n=1 Tax=Massilia sp. CMS3.1 TaxID=3373083 RepID=UPI003EE43B7C